MKTPLLATQKVDVQKLTDTPDLPNYSAPGTGKTLTTIGAIEAMGLQSGLVIAPVIACPMWARTIEQELGAKVQLLKTGSMKVDGSADFHVMSYGMASSHFPSFIARKIGALVLDESHYLKTPTSLRTMKVFGKNTDGVGGLFETSQYCFTLTGTPIDRYQDDAWAQLRAIQPELLTKYGALALGKFRDKFTTQAVKQFNPRMRPELCVVGSKNMTEFNRMVYQDLGAIARSIADVDAHMPSITFRHLDAAFTNTHEMRMLMRHKTMQDVAVLLEGGDLAMVEARRLLGIAKAKAVAEYVLESAATGPVLVGYWHKEVGSIIAQFLRSAGVNAVRIGGDTPIMERDEIASGFNTGEIRVVVGQIVAAGVSLNLQTLCRHVIMAEMDWSPGKVSQFFKRVWRLGQKNHVQVDYMVADHLIDEANMAVLHNKQRAITAGNEWNDDFSFIE